MAVEANQLLVEALNAGAIATCTTKEGYTESHAEYAKELRNLLRERREVRQQLAMAYSCDDENRQLELTIRITTISKWLRRHKQRHWKRVEEDRVRAFEEARPQGDFREVHRTARLIAAKGRGPRRRNCRQLYTSGTASEWITRVQKEGVQGGASVQVVSYDAMLQMVHDLPEMTSTVTADETEADVEAFKHEVWRLRLWRVAPQEHERLVSALKKYTATLATRVMRPS